MSDARQYPRPYSRTMLLSLPTQVLALAVTVLVAFACLTGDAEAQRARAYRPPPRISHGPHPFPLRGTIEKRIEVPGHEESAIPKTGDNVVDKFLQKAHAEEWEQARESLYQFGFKDDVISIFEFQKAYGIPSNGRLDRGTRRELRTLRDLRAQSHASAHTYLVAAVIRQERATEGLYRVLIPGKFTRVIDKADEIGQYIAEIAKERGFQTTYVQPYMSKQEAHALEVSISQQSGKHASYVLRNAHKEEDFIFPQNYQRARNAISDTVIDPVNMTLLAPRNANSKVGVIEARIITTGEMTGRVELRANVVTPRGSLNMRIVGMAKNVIVHFVGQLQYYLSMLSNSLSVAAAIHKAKADVMQAYGISADQLQVYIEDQAGNTQVAELTRRMFVLAENH